MLLITCMIVLINSYEEEVETKPSLGQIVQISIFVTYSNMRGYVDQWRGNMCSMRVRACPRDWIDFCDGP